MRLAEEARNLATSLKDQEGKAMACNNIGSCYFRTGETKNALDYYQQAVALFAATGDEGTEAISLMCIGRVYKDAGDTQKAMGYYQQALPMARRASSKAVTAEILYNIGEVYRLTGDKQKALVSYQQSVPLYQASSDRVDSALPLNGLGIVYEDSGNIQKALDSFQQALVLLDGSSNTPAAFSTLVNIGEAYRVSGNPLKALESYRQAMLLPNAASDKAGEAGALNHEGQTYSDTGDPQEALACYQQALPLARAARDKAEESAILNNTGLVYKRAGKPQSALNYYQQALLLKKAVSDRSGEAVTIANMGEVYEDAGEPQKALEYYQQSLLIAQAVGDSTGAASTLNDIGTAYLSVGNPEIALASFQKALPILQAMGDKAGMSITMSNIGSAFSATGSPRKALECFQQALTLAQTSYDKAEEATSLNNIGNIYADDGNIQKALDSYRQALSLVQAINDKAGEATTLRNIGSVYEADDLQKALEYYQKSMGIDEGFCSQMSDPAQVAAFQDYKVGDLNAHIANVLFRLNRPGDALAALERGRTNGLARLAAQNRLSLSALIGKDATAWQQANNHLMAADQQMQKIREGVDNAQAVKDAAEEKYFSQRLRVVQEQEQQAEAGRNSLFDRLKRDHPDFQRLFLSQQLPIATLTKGLLTPQNADTLFLDYATVDDKKSLLFTLSKNDGLHAFSFPIGRRALTDAVGKWCVSIQGQGSDEPQQARDLCQILLPPAMKELLRPGRYRFLVIVGDGPLLDAPFAALIDGSGKRLIQRYALSTPFSLSMLTWPTPARSATHNLLAVANPLGPKPDLPSTEQQARRMLPSFQPDSLLSGAKADKRSVLAQIGQCRLLHFGVHGEANSQNGLYSRLFLAGKTEENQTLTAAEVTEHPLAAQLTVLSACETAQGQKSGGEGLMGLAWAFRAAGCPSVIASQWKVDEGATASLMSRFYQGLLKKERKDDALRQAMLGVMGEPGRAAPYYWAAFQVIGKTTPLQLIPRTAGSSGQ